jgi:outer membrane receptor protein involved in Fe transport
VKLLQGLEHGGAGSMLRWSRLTLFFLALLCCSVAEAQTVSSILGTAEDADGNPIAAIRVRISGESLMGGEQQQVTEGAGRVRFVDLLPGVYRVEANAEGFQSVRFDDVRLSPGDTSDLTFVMVLPTSEDVFSVTQEQPALDFRKTSLGGSLSRELMRALPQAEPNYLETARFFSGVDIGFSSGYPQISGGSNYSNSFMIDGANVTDPTLHGFSANLNYGAVCDMEVQTGGFSAEYGDFTGGMLNVVTCSGSNQHRGEVSGRYLGSSLSLEGPTPQGDLSVYGTSVNAGGPVIRDRLWYFTSVEYGKSEAVPAGLSSEGRQPFVDSWLYTMVKLTAAPRSSDRITLLLQNDADAFSDAIQSANIAPSAELWQDQGGYLASLRWDGNYGNLGIKANLTRRKSGIVSFPGARSSGLGFPFGLLPPYVDQTSFGIAGGCFSSDGENFSNPSCTQDIQDDPDFGNGAIVDISTGEISQSYFVDTEIFKTRDQFSTTLSLFRPALLWGDHEFRVGVDVVRMSQDRLARLPGGGAQFYYDTDGDGEPNPYYASIASSADNALKTSVSGNTYSLFALDNWDLFQRVRLQPGVRIDKASYLDSGDESVLDFLTISPRFGFSVDLLGDAMTRLHGGAGLLIETGNLSLSELKSGSLERTRAFYNAETERYEINPDNQFVQGGVGSATIGGRVKPLETRELQLGIGHAIVKDHVFDLTWMSRETSSVWEDREVNLLYSRDGATVEGAVNGERRKVKELASWSGTARTYTGYTLSHELRVEKRWLLNNSYTLSWLEGASEGLPSAAFDNPAEAPFLRGPLAGDHRHTMKLQGAFFASNGVTLGAEYQFVSGAPYSKTFRAPGTETDLRAGPTGVDPGDNLNDPSDDVELRLPDLTQLNLRITYDLARVIGQKLELAFNVENALNLRTITAVDTREGSTFGHPLAYQNPLSGQLVATYSY